MPDRRNDRRIRGAALRQVRNAGLGRRRPNRPHRPDAAMRAVPSAASRQVHIRVGRKGQHRRNQRKAEDNKQNDAEHASHTAIVAKFDSHMSEICNADSNFVTESASRLQSLSLLFCMSFRSAAEESAFAAAVACSPFTQQNRHFDRSCSQSHLSSAPEKSASLPPRLSACVAHFVSVSAVAFAFRAWLQREQRASTLK